MSKQNKLIKIDLFDGEVPNSTKLLDFAKKFVEALENSDDYSDWVDYENKTFLDASGWEFQNEEVCGGGEGDGEEHWVVFSLSKDDKKTYFKIPGWYQSHHGSECENSDMFEVVAKEKVITVWEKK